VRRSTNGAHIHGEGNVPNDIKGVDAKNHQLSPEVVDEAVKNVQELKNLFDSPHTIPADELFKDGYEGLSRKPDKNTQGETDADRPEGKLKKPVCTPTDVGIKDLKDLLDGNPENIRPGFRCEVKRRF
jgi:hypothetical protein